MFTDFYFKYLISLQASTLPIALDEEFCHSSINNVLKVLLN